MQHFKSNNNYLPAIIENYFYPVFYVSYRHHTYCHLEGLNKLPKVIHFELH